MTINYYDLQCAVKPYFIILNVFDILMHFFDDANCSILLYRKNWSYKMFCHVQFPTALVRCPSHLWAAALRRYRYVMERHRVLGPDLATAHFVIARGGAVKLVGQDDWVEQKNNRVPLPNVFVPEMFVEAIDASNTQMMYCSFDNFGEPPGPTRQLMPVMIMKAVSY